MRFTYRIVIAIAILLSTLRPAFANDPKPVTVADLAWMAGVWKGEVWGGVGEEQWAKPAGDSMIGMFSFVKDGKPVFYEFLSLEKREEGVVMHLRHFHPRLVAWEEKDSPLLFVARSYSRNEVVFERIDSAATRVKIIYRLEAPDQLAAIIEKVKDGKESKDVVRYRRVTGN